MHGLVCLLATFSTIGAVPPASHATSHPHAIVETPDEAAQKLLERAEARAREGRFADARAEYEKLAAKYPDTPAGREAAERSRPSAFLGWADVVRHGPSSNRVDVVLMGDGYELGHMDAFAKLAADVPPLFERQSTFREYYEYFNFLRADLVSKDSGVDGFGREYDTALGGKTLGTFAGHVGIERKLVFDVLAKIPDSDGQAIVFVKNGVLGTGGSGIATIGGREVKTVIHEFGHSFGRLSDEYDAQQSHDAGPARDGINVAANEDPQKVPWAHWIAVKHPGVGVYEGALGRVRGAWRPTSTGCVMSSDERFCVVCREALVLAIYARVDPIDSESPPAPETREFLELGREPLTLSIKVLKPATHALEVKWWVLRDELPSEAERAPTGRSRSAGERGKPRARANDRTQRGPLGEITAKPRASTRTTAGGGHEFVLSREALEPGRYRIVVRAKDTTELRGEKFPWVLKDELGLLESERVWWIEVPAAR
ncbi:MAG: M64 family metallo-endopeptidase [Planctomycetes bacterium]|nr:M64 family metallo-endopeptidase [Planctomycetota bacterium]